MEDTPEKSDLGIIDQAKKAAQKEFFGKLIGWIGNKFGEKKRRIIIIILGFLFSLFVVVFTVTSFIANIKTIFPDKQSNGEELRSPTPILEVTKSSLEDEKIKGIVTSPCDGTKVSIMEDFADPLGKEKDIWIDPEDPSIMSASSAAGFQVAKIYPFECSAPWTATVSAIQLGSKSIGMFFEFEDVFKILIGDGDLLNWKIEENDLGKRGNFQKVLREKLIYGKVSPNTQLTLIVKGQPSGKGNLLLDITIGYFPENKDNYMWQENRNILIRARAADLVAVPARRFRIGINDFRYKGEGSKIKFQAFSVKSNP